MVRGMGRKTIARTNIGRRSALKLAGAAGLWGAVPARARGETPADHTLRIATGLVELGANAVVSTKLYNGQFPGPLLRLDEGRPATVDVYNDTDTPEQFHMHGLHL